MNYLSIFCILIIHFFILNNATAQSYEKLNLTELEAVIDQYISENQPLKAVPVFYAIFDKIPKEQDSLALAWRENLAFFYINIGQFNNAIPVLDTLKKTLFKKQGVEHPAYLNCLNSLGFCHFQIGHYDNAEKFWEACLNLLEHEDPNRPLFLNNLGALYRKTGSYELAEPLFIQSKNNAKKTHGQKSIDYARSLNNLASLYQSMKLYNKAKPLFIEAIGLIEELNGKISSEYAQYSSNLGTVYFNLKDYKSATSIFLEALEIDIKKHGDYSPQHHRYLNHIGNAYLGLKENTLAEAYFLKALDVLEKNSQKHHHEYAFNLNQLNIVATRKKDRLKILTYTHQAIQSASGMAIGQQITKEWADSLKTIPSYSYQNLNQLLTALQYLYIFYQAPQDPHKQKIIAEVALSILSNSRNQLSGNKDKLRLLSLSNQWMLRNLKHLDFEKDFLTAFELIEKDKLVLLQQASQNKAAYQFSNFPDSLIQQEKAFQNNKQTLKAKLLENRKKEEKDSLRTQLNEVNHSLKLFKAKVEAEFPKYTQFKYQELELDLQEIQHTLKEQTALIEYALDDSLVYIFYISQAKTFVHHFPIDQKDLKKRITDLHYSLSNYSFITKNKKKAFTNYTKNAYWFYEKFLAPVLAKEAGIHQLIFITDRELGHLPFEVFLTKETGQKKGDYQTLPYLVNDYKVSYNYSTTQWLNTQKNTSKNTSAKHKGAFFAMAANYNSTIDSAIFHARLPAYRRMRALLAPLPAARKEVKQLSEQFSGFFGFDSLATESVLKEKISNYDIIHLATHGLLDSKHPIMSSIALTEDNNLNENNFLHAYEISKLELHAKLVVLSACETGFGKFEKGNGIASLARSFMYAGAPALVVSLWQVNDFATSSIMTTFYKNLSNGMNKSEALQAAKLNYIQRSKGIMGHPAFWSPFILIGNEDPIYIAQKNSTSNYLYGGIFLTVLLGLVFFLFRKRKKKE